MLNKYSFCRSKAIADKFYKEKYGKPCPHEFGLNTVECENTVLDYLIQLLEKRIKNMRL